MTLTTPYSATFYVGDGETKTFPYLFEEVSESFISVIVYNSPTGQSSTPTYIVDTDQKQVIFGDDTPAPTADETVCIYRNTPNVQDTPFRTLQGYDAKALENILSKIVAMIQEIKSNYFTTQVLQGDPWQLDLLTSADDGATVNIDYTAKKLVKGLYFQITDGNLQVSADGSNYITMPKSDDIAEFRQVSITLEDLSVIKKLQYRVGNEWFDAEANAQATADEALSLAQTVQGGLSSHVSNVNNPHQTNLVNLKDTNITSPVSGQFIMFDGLKWKNVYSSATAGWGTIIGNITDQTDLMNKFTEYVRTDGSSTMTNPLMMRATEDFKCAIAPYWDGVGFFKLNDNNSVSLMASIEYNSGFEPATTNTYNIGALTRKWKNLYLSGKAYMSVINNGYDIAVPVTNSADTFALKSEVDLAANSGRMITAQGVWYAKMYTATVAPAAENGTNYADFSQVDGQGNPIIVIYTRTNGAWVQDQTITPPAEYDGYVPITSKIWGIPEQAGQQGGRILWNHQSKEFTPYPQIISFKNINVTGESTVDIPLNPTSNQIVNKDYVDSLVANSGTGRNVGDIFFTMRTDSALNGAVDCNGGTYNTGDFTGAQSIGDLLEDGKVPYVSLSTYATLLSTQGSVGVFGWDGAGNTTFRVPSLNDIFVETGTASEIGDYLSAGVPNITAKVTFTGDTNAVVDSTSGAAYATADSRYHDQGAGGSIYTPATVLIDAGQQNPIYGNSNTVQPETIRYRAMVQLAISATDEAVITCTAITSQVAANTSAINGADYVVESQLPTALNNYTWYRKYKSGWVEQGGQFAQSGDGIAITLPVEMADADYPVVCGTLDNSGAQGWRYANRTTTGFTKNLVGSTNCGGSWEVSGMAAS